MASGAHAAKRTTTAIRHSVLIGFGLVMVAPLAFALYTSLLRPQDYLSLVGPGELTLDNYEFVIQNAPIGRWFSSVNCGRRCWRSRSARSGQTAYDRSARIQSCSLSTSYRIARPWLGWPTP